MKVHTRTFLTDFSKAFECYNHNLLIAKLTPYRVDIKFLPQKQKTKYES